MAEPLWAPAQERIDGTAIEELRRRVNERHGVELHDSSELHRWSVDHLAAFWEETWDHLGVIGDRGTPSLDFGDEMIEARFFPEATLNVVDTLLDGRGAGDDEAAIEYRREDGLSRTISWAELRSETAAFAAALTTAGVGPGDRVAAWMPHVPETIIAMLGAAAIGAVFTSTSADFGPTGVVDRFGQVEPKVLVAADGYRYGGKAFSRIDELGEIRRQLPSVTTIVSVGVLDPEARQEGATTWGDFLAPHRGIPLEPQPFPFDHPWYILYSSGTTGKPKCIVHKCGGVLLKHLQEQHHHLDIKPGDRVFYFTTCGWMMWNWLVSALGMGATIVLFDGNPGFPGPEALFDLADETDLTFFGVSAKFLDVALKSGLRPVDSHRLGSLRTIASTGSPLSADSFSFVYDGIKADVHLASISGGTDLCGCLVGGDPTRPVFAGEIQGPALGMAMEVFDDDGQPMPTGQGELVCTAPFPSMPLTFWGDGGDDRYRSAYFDRYPGVWAQGDYAMWTERGGLVILGRSDATLNASGVRIGTSEIYRVVESFDEVLEAVAVGRRDGADTQIVLYVRMSDGASLDDDLERSIRHRLKTEESPRHVPVEIIEIDDIPRTRSGKISELAVTAVVNGHPVKNSEALANPESLHLFKPLSSRH